MRHSQYIRLKGAWRKQEIILNTLISLLKRANDKHNQDMSQENLSKLANRADRLYVKLHAVYPANTGDFRFSLQDILDIIKSIRELKKDCETISIFNEYGSLKVELHLAIRTTKE